MSKVARLHRAAVQIPLSFIACIVLHETFLFDGLNAFSNNFEVKSRRKFCDRFNDRLVFFIAARCR